MPDAGIFPTQPNPDPASPKGERERQAGAKCKVVLEPPLLPPPPAPVSLRAREVSALFRGSRGRLRTRKAEVLPNAVGVGLKPALSPEACPLGLHREAWMSSREGGGVVPGQPCPTVLPAASRHKHDGGGLGSVPSPAVQHRPVPRHGDAGPHRLPGALISAPSPLRRTPPLMDAASWPPPFLMPRAQHCA